MGAGFCWLEEVLPFFGAKKLRISAGIVERKSRVDEKVSTDGAGGAQEQTSINAVDA